MSPFVNRFQKWRYLYLLCALLVFLVVHPIWSGLVRLESLFDALFVVIMVMLVLALAQDKAWRIVACILCIPAATLSLGGYFLPTSAQVVSVTAGHAFGALFFAAVTGKILHTILTSRDLSMDSVFGAICGYLLLGVAWAFTYAMIHTVNPESFQFSESIQQQMESEDYRRNVFIYYSFVTLTTVGYGDLTPLSIPARNLSWVEAMTGQLYMAVLIAGLMSALVARNTTRARQTRDP